MNFSFLSEFSFSWKSFPDRLSCTSIPLGFLPRFCWLSARHKLFSLMESPTCVWTISGLVALAKFYCLLECMQIGASHSCLQCTYISSRILWWEYPQRPQDGNIITQKKVEFSELACIYPSWRYTCPQSVANAPGVLLCLYSPHTHTHTIYSFLFLPPLHKENKETCCPGVQSKEEPHIFFSVELSFSV